jgi:hypothetical protein
MSNRNPSDVAAALIEATAQVTRESRALGLCAQRQRIWIVRSHLGNEEILAWDSDLAGKAVRSIAVGPEPLLVYQRLSRVCRPL